jgi:aquaporin Z
LPRKMAAELVGTALLVYFGVGVATLTFGFGSTGTSFMAGVVATALAFGLTLMALAYAIGPISGCHVNPAVTIGMLLSGRMTLQEAGSYWGAQFAGGIIGALALWLTFHGSSLYNRTITGLGADGYGSASHIHIDAGGAFLAEALLTAFFVFVILQVTSKGAAVALQAGLIIGLTLTVVHLIGIPITGTSVNPARSLGPAIVAGGTALKQVWLFILAPLVGGVIAAGAHLLFQPKDEVAAAAPADTPVEAAEGAA